MAKFTLVPGSYGLGRDQAAALVTAYEKLHDKNRGKVTKFDLLAVSADVKSNTHGLFEWNDGKAARAYRLHQAEQYLSIIVLATPVRQANARPMRVAASESRVRVETLTPEQVRAQLLRDALRDAAAWMDRHQTLRESTELRDVFDAIEDARRDYVDESFNNKARRTT